MICQITGTCWRQGINLKVRRSIKSKPPRAVPIIITAHSLPFIATGCVVKPGNVYCPTSCKRIICFFISIWNKRWSIGLVVVFGFNPPGASCHIKNPELIHRTIKVTGWTFGIIKQARLRAYPQVAVACYCRTKSYAWICLVIELTVNVYFSWTIVIDRRNQMPFPVIHPDSWAKI